MSQTPNEPGPAAEPGLPPDAGEIELLRAQLADAETRAGAARDAQLRALADLDNARRRVERELATGLKYAAEKILGDLLGVADSLELGLKAAATADAKALVEGMQLTYKQLLAVLDKHGVKPIDPVGQPFNPELHQAMSMAESAEVAPNHIVAVMQKGYKLHDRLLRPATVVVARASAQNP
jgi:molecular chaperone GrpE